MKLRWALALGAGDLRPAAGYAAIVVAIAATTALLTCGCGAGALAAQADLLALGGIAAARADAVIIDARGRDLDGVLEEARAECGEGGCTDERAEAYRAELARREAAWSPALACRAPIVEALRTWGDGIETANAARTESIGLALVAELLGAFLRTWSALASCLEAAPASIDLPTLDPSLLLGGAS